MRAWHLLAVVRHINELSDSNKKKTGKTVLMKTTILILAIMSIISQIPHSFYVTKHGSNLLDTKIAGKKWLTSKKHSGRCILIDYSNRHNVHSYTKAA